jgi:hypothetical protein
MQPSRGLYGANGLELPLAPLGPACYQLDRNVRREPTFSKVGFGARSALAALLAVLFSVAAFVSVSHGLHRALHLKTATVTHVCLICSLAKGHVTVADALPVLALLAAVLVFSLPVLQKVRYGASDRRLAPSRAPPFRSSAS